MDAIKKILSKKGTKRSQVHSLRTQGLDLQASASTINASAMSALDDLPSDDYDQVHSLNYGPPTTSQSADVSRRNSRSSRYQSSQSHVHQRHDSVPSMPLVSHASSAFAMPAFHEKSVWEDLDIHSKPDDAVVNELFEKFMECKDIDESKRASLRSVPINTKWDMIKQQKNERAAFPDRIDKSKPDYFVMHLQNSRETGVNLKLLKNLRVSIVNRPVTWLKDFTNLSGLELMIDLLSDIHAKKSLALTDVEVEHEIIIAFRAYMNNGFGFQTVLSHDDCLYEIALSMHSPNVDTSRIVVEILACICNYNIGAHQLVLRTIDRVQHVRSQGTRFATLKQLIQSGLRELSRKRDKEHLYLLIGCMMLLNALLQTPADLMFRIHLRNQLFACGIKDLLQSLRDFDNEELQSVVAQLDEDTEMDAMYFMEEYELSKTAWEHPSELFNGLVQSTRNCPSYPHFLNILQLLSYVRNDSAIKCALHRADMACLLIADSLRAAYFGLIAECIAMIVLDGRGIDPDFSSHYRIDLDRLLKSLSHRQGIMGEPLGRLKPLSRDASNGTEFTMKASETLQLIDSLIENLDRKMAQDHDQNLHSLSALAANIQRPLLDMTNLENASMSESLVSPALDGSSSKVAPIAVATEPLSKTIESLPCAALLPSSSPSPLLPSPPALLSRSVSLEPLPSLPVSQSDANPVLVAPLPPPPPPPPPPLSIPFCHQILNSSLPPPPPLFNMTTNAKKLKLFPWDKLHDVRNTVWELVQVSDIEESKLNLARIDKEFASDTKKKEPVVKREPAEISYLDVCKARNINIMLGRVKYTFSELSMAILRLDESVLDDAVVGQFISAIPFSLIDKYKNAPQSDISKFGKADQFVFVMLKIPMLKEILGSIRVKYNFKDKQKSLAEARALATARRQCASEQVVSSPCFRSILFIILNWGNRLNNGTMKGAAKGFSLQSLLRMTDFKATKSDLTAMVLLVETLRDSLPALCSFESEIRAVHEASKLSLIELDDGMKALNGDLAAVQSMIEVFRKESHEMTSHFIAAIETFMAQSQSSLDALNDQYARAKDKFCQSVRFYAESVDTSTPESFFGVFAAFCSLYTKTLDSMKSKQEESLLKESRKKTAASAQRSVSTTHQHRACLAESTPIKDENQQGVMDDLLSKLRSGKSSTGTASKLAHSLLKPHFATALDTRQPKPSVTEGIALKATQMMASLNLKEPSS